MRIFRPRPRRRKNRQPQVPYPIPLTAEAAGFLQVKQGPMQGHRLEELPVYRLEKLTRAPIYPSAIKRGARMLLPQRRQKIAEEQSKLPTKPTPNPMKRPLQGALAVSRSGTIVGETSWQVGLKEACTHLSGFSRDVPHALGLHEGKADLEYEGVPVGLLDLDRKGDVGRINQLCNAAMKPVIILKGADSTPPGIDQEGYEVISTLKATHGCQVLIQHGQQLYWKDGNDWVPATSNLAQQIQSAIQKDEAKPVHKPNPNAMEGYRN